MSENGDSPESGDGWSPYLSHKLGVICENPKDNMVTSIHTPHDDKSATQETQSVTICLIFYVHIQSSK